MTKLGENMNKAITILESFDLWAVSHPLTIFILTRITLTLCYGA